ncbi:MAG: ABC transporter permease [Armatimonadota bacterium]|nr:ABC transporter permease [bacterium]
MEQLLADWPEVKKPGALRTLWHHRELVYSLTQRDIRSRYKQSVLGILWALLQPLAMTAVFTIVMSYIAKVDTKGIPYPIFAYIAMLPWTFFAGGLTSGTECLVGNFNLITKIYFPREVFPISAVLGKLVDLALGAIVLAGLFVICRVHINAWILMTLPILIIETALLLGVTFILSSANLFYRDIRHVLPLLTQVWMYMSPIIYGLDLVPKRFFNLYMLNPMAVLIDATRTAALRGEPPMWNWLGYSAVLSIVVLILGYRMFKKLEPLFAETI